MYKIITKNKIVNNSFFFSTIIVKLILFGKILTIKVGILSIMLIQHLQ